MVDLDDLLERAAARGTARGADDVWASAHEPVSPALPAAIAERVEPSSSYVDAGPSARHRPVSPLVRLVATAAAVALVAVGVALWRGASVARQPGVVGADSASSAAVPPASRPAPTPTSPLAPPTTLPIGSTATSGAAGGFVTTTASVVTDPTALTVAGAPTIGVFGDSTGLMTGIGLQGWWFNERTANVIGGAVLGCGLRTDAITEFPDLDGTLARQPPRAECAFDDRWPRFVDTHSPLALAVVEFGLQDLADFQLPGDEQWRHLGDPVFDDVLRQRMATAMAVFTSRAIPVVWLAAPHIRLGYADRPPVDYPMNDPNRIDRFNELLRETAAGNPAVTVVDLPGYLARLPGGEMDRTARADGVHLSAEAAEQLAADGLGDEILRHARP